MQIVSVFEYVCKILSLYLLKYNSIEQQAQFFLPFGKKGIPCCTAN